MLSLSNKDRCKKCYNERALRMCPRIRKGLCWRCCNDLRIDLRCPATCPYAGKIVEDNPLPAFKSDTYAEMQAALKAYIDIWVGKAKEGFSGQSPKTFASLHPDDMLKWLSGFQYPDFFPLDYLMHRLELELERDLATQSQNPEEIAAAYLKSIVALEYDQLWELTLNRSPLAELRHRYQDILSKIPFLKKVTNFSYIHTSTSEDATQCIVFVELNFKQEWALVLRQEEGKWYVRQNINGNPSLYFKQNELYQRIATLLANAEEQKAFFEISEALRSYVDSADLHYYRALYWLLVKQVDKAKVDFFNAIALDNLFSPPYMHLGLLYLNAKDYPESRLWFAALVELEPENDDAANNLAIATLASGDVENALQLWRSILHRNPGYELASKNLQLYG